MMFSMLGFFLIFVIIVIVNCGFLYFVWIDDGLGCGGYVFFGFFSYGGFWNYSCFFLLNILVLSFWVNKLVGFIDVG